MKTTQSDHKRIRKLFSLCCRFAGRVGKVATAVCPLGEERANIPTADIPWPGNPARGVLEWTLHSHRRTALYSSWTARWAKIFQQSFDLCYV